MYYSKQKSTFFFFNFNICSVLIVIFQSMFILDLILKTRDNNKWVYDEIIFLINSTIELNDFNRLVVRTELNVGPILYVQLAL